MVLQLATEATHSQYLSLLFFVHVNRQNDYANNVTGTHLYFKDKMQRKLVIVHDNLVTCCLGGASYMPG